jgi:hypothetical protein
MLRVHRGGGLRECGLFKKLLPFTPEQHADFVTRLRRIEGHKINVYFAPDPEPSRLAQVIIVALHAAEGRRERRGIWRATG